MTVVDNSNLPATIYSNEWIEQFASFCESLRSDAKQRRRKKTPKGITKKREIGGGKSISYVDRPEYQKWLDENFPGWSVELVGQPFATLASFEGKYIPVSFSVAVHLIVIEKGLKRTIPGIGSATISSKEVNRDNTQLLKLKFTIALTDAIKVACGWLGAFYDLRVDEEARERATTPPNEEQTAKFNALLRRVPENGRDATKAAFVTQNQDTVIEFLEALERKIIQLEETVAHAERARTQT